MRYLFKLFFVVFFLTGLTVNAQNTQQVTAVQFFFNTDPGIGNAGNGAIQNFTGNGIYTQSFNVMLPSNLSPGFNTFFVRAKDEYGRWSPIEKGIFYVLDQLTGSSINAYEYYFDNDPGVGNGTLTSVISTTSLNVALNITVPNLNDGFHQLYVRSRSSSGAWSVIDHNMIYVSAGYTQTITALEYYFDVDPGIGNATAYPVTASASLNIAANVFTPCLATGNHYLFVRAKDNLGKWSIVEKDTLTITNGINPLTVSPGGPLSFCPGTPVTLSTTNVQGIAYQWLKDGIMIPSATNATYVVTTTGNYSVITVCGSNTITSNVVSITALTLNTYYRDFDVDTYGDINTPISACTQPSGYVNNSTDCNDNDVAVHQNVSYYLDADHDQYSPGSFIVACNSPGPNYILNSLGNDCNDADADIHPGAFDIPGNNIDENCNGQIAANDAVATPPFTGLTQGPAAKMSIV